MSSRFDAHMSDSDALMWNIERDPILRSTIVAVLTLDRPPDWDALVTRVEQAARAIPRMQQRVVTPLFRVGPPHWSPAPDLDLRYHLRRVRVPEPGSFADLLDVARNAATTPFDRAQPLWEYTVVEGLADGSAALVLKVHHSMTDGVGGLALLMDMLDLEREPAPRPSALLDDEPGDAVVLTPTGLVLPSIDHRRRRALGIVRRGATEAVGGALRFARDPVRTTSDAARAGRSVAGYLAPSTAPRSPIMRGRTLARDLATFDVPLDGLKAAGRAGAGSLNDAFVAATVGGIASYHEFHGARLDDLRMTMPISLRTASDSAAGNHFTPARFLVPAAIKDPAERIAAMSERSRWIRAEPAVGLTDALATVFNAMPMPVTTAVLGSMLKCADFVASNVPGAPVPLYGAGALVTGVYAFGPLSGSAANVTLISHCGSCCIGVNTDAGAIPDPELFVEHLAAAFAEVLALAP